MRSILIAAAGLLGLAVVPFIRPAPRSQGAVRPVVLTVTCTGQGVNFSLSPWVVGLNAANPVEWRVNGSANTDEITIEPKDPGQWPFEEPPPYIATKSTPKRGGALKAGLQPGQVFRYTVTLQCRTPTSGPFRVVIDPDMVVD